MSVELDWSVHIRSFPGAPRGGDMGLVTPCADGALVALVDATGHGLPAYSVAQAARKILLAGTEMEPGALLHKLNDVLRGTIGAAISVAQIRGNTLAFAGIGNVSATLGGQSLSVRPGIVGQRMRDPQVVSCQFPPESWLIMHTDGVTAPSTVPRGSAETAARAIVEANGSLHDDAGIVMVRWRLAP